MDELPFRCVSVSSEMVIHNEKSFSVMDFEKDWTVEWDYRHFQDYGSNLRRLAKISNMFVLGESFVLGENTQDHLHEATQDYESQVRAHFLLQWK